MLAVLLGGLSAGVLTQAVLAGLFLSGLSGARLAHTVVGWLLPYAALVVAVVAGVHHGRRTCPPAVAVAVYPLPVLLWVQEVLGHLPAPATTAVHVPLGVTLAVYPAVLGVVAVVGRQADAPPTRGVRETIPARRRSGARPNPRRWARMAGTALVGLGTGTALVGVVVDRDAALGVDELSVLVVALTLVALVELGVFLGSRRDRTESDPRP